MSAEDRAALRAACEALIAASKGHREALFPMLPVSMVVNFLDTADAFDALLPEAIRMTEIASDLMVLTGANDIPVETAGYPSLVSSPLNSPGVGGVGARDFFGRDGA